MNSKWRFVVLAFAIVATVGLGAQAPPQPAGPPSATNELIAALVAETRALRAELANANRVNIRSQLLVARVQLQEQRLMHLDRQRSEVTTKRLDNEKARAALAGQLQQMQNMIGQSGDPKEREVAPFLLDGLKTQLQSTQANEATLRGEEDTLLNSISAEQARWNDFNSRLDELERSLPSR
jgi:hypothetical protein